MGSRLKSLESEMQQVEGEYQNPCCSKPREAWGPCL